ncbi:MAG: hypothetical protein ACLUAR_10600 [Pilosibacter sp.]
MAEKVQAAAGKLLNGYVMETELTELNGFHFFLLNYDPDDRMQIRRQMKALLSEIRVQGDILKNLAVTMALGEGVRRLSEIGISLKNARLLIEERLLGGTGKLMEGSIDSGESFADSEELCEIQRPDLPYARESGSFCPAGRTDLFKDKDAGIKGDQRS